MIFQAMSHAGTIGENRDVDIAELINRTNPAPEQNRRTPISSSGQDDLLAVDDLTGLRELNPHGAVSSTDYSVGRHAVSKGEIRSASGGMEIRARRGATNAS